MPEDKVISTLGTILEVLLSNKNMQLEMHERTALTNAYDSLTKSEGEQQDMQPKPPEDEESDEGSKENDPDEI